MHDDQFPQTPWYKTGAGITFLGILGIFVTLIVGFSGLVGYYSVKIQKGQGEDIAQSLAEARTSFSVKQGASQDTAYTIQDIAPYIRKTDPQYGNLTSPVTIVAFIDFECPYCQEAYPTFETLRQKYADGIHIIFKHFPLDSIHPSATKAALAASCAAEQKQFWPYYQLLFTKKDLSTEALLSYADTLGLNTSVFEACFSSERYRTQIFQDIQDGLDLGVRGTPTYFINTTRLEGVIPLSTWNTEIISAIQSQSL